MKIGVLTSGNLGFVVLKKLYNHYKIELVFTDTQSKEIIEFSISKNIDTFVGNPRNGKCKDFIKDKSIDVLISINYIFIIEKDLINLPNKLAFNIHGSILPKYRGRTPHVWAIINNEKQTGITAHVIDDGCDTGDVIEQITVPIKEYDTGADILNKFRNLYTPLIKMVLEKLKTNKLVFVSQNDKKATLFEKRSPEDGKIDWNWQKERIRNWVRAQSSPYPGAFTFLNSLKIIIDELKFDSFGFYEKMPNGLILTINPIRVKTPNGVVVLSKIREGKDIINTGEILGNEN